MLIELLGDAINTDLIVEITKIQSNRDSHIRHSFDIKFSANSTKQISLKANCFVTSTPYWDKAQGGAYKPENVFLSWQQMTFSREYKLTLNAITALRERLIKTITKSKVRYKIDYDTLES